MEEQRPRFSLLMPAYNAEKTLSRAVESVLVQEFEDWELIIVDDGSTDATLSIARKCAETDSRIRIFTQENQGVDGARTCAQNESRGQLLMPLDADDELVPDCLAAMDAFVGANPGYDIYSSNGYFLDETLHDARPRPYFTTPRFLESTSVSYEDMLEECWLLGGGSCVTRELVASMGGYRRGFRTEDYDMWMRALARGARHIYNPRCLYIYHYGAKGHVNEDQTLTFESFAEVLQDIIDSGVLDDRRVEETLVGIEHYRSRVDATFMDKVAVNAHMRAQAGAVYRMVSHIVPRRFVPVIMKILYILKRPFTPLRMKLAEGKAGRTRKSLLGQTQKRERKGK